VLGARLAVAQGLMLLMSYSGPSTQAQSADTAAFSAGARGGGGSSSPSSSVAAVVREIEAEPAVSRVEEAQFWQVHYGLCMANLRVCVVRGCHDGAQLSHLRARVARVVQNRLGEGYGRGGGLRWEVTTQMSVDGS